MVSRGGGKEQGRDHNCQANKFELHPGSHEGQTVRRCEDREHPENDKMKMVF